MNNTASIVFKGVDKVSDVIDNIKGSTERLNRETENSGALTATITKQMAANWLKVSTIVAAVIMSVKKLTDTLDEGMRLRIETEGAEKTFAGLIGTFYDFKDSFGNVVDESKKFNLALIESKKLMAEIEKISVKTGVSKNELSEAVMAGISAGAGKFSNEEIVAIAGKVAATGNMIGLNSNQLKSELKAILSGSINNNSDIGGMLGLKGDKLYEEALKAGKGFEYLSERFKSIDKSIEENSDSIGSYFSSLDAFALKFKESISEDYTKSFKDLKGILTELTDDVGNFSTPVQGVVGFLNGLGGEIGNIFSSARNAGFEFFESIGRFLSENNQNIRASASIFAEAFGLIFNILKEIGQVFFDVVGVIGKLVNSFTSTLIPATEDGAGKFEGLSSILRVIAASLNLAGIGFTLFGDTISSVINFVKIFVVNVELAIAKLKGFFTDTTEVKNGLIKELEELKSFDAFKDTKNRLEEFKVKFTSDPQELKNQVDEINSYQKVAMQQQAEEDLKLKLDVIQKANDFQKSLLSKQERKLDIENSYSSDRNSDTYYQKKIEFAKKVAQVEIEGLNKILALETDVNKKQEIENQLRLKRLDLSNTLLDLEKKRKQESENRAKKELKDIQDIARLDLSVEKKKLQNQLDDVQRLENEKAIDVNTAHQQRISILTAIHQLEQQALANEIAQETDKLRIIQLQAQMKLNDLNFENTMLNLQSKLNVQATKGVSTASSRVDKQKELNALMLEQKMILLNNQQQLLDLDKDEGNISREEYYTKKIDLIKKQYELETGEIKKQIALAGDSIEKQKLNNSLMEKELAINVKIREVLNEKKQALVGYKDELLSIQQELQKNSTGLNNIDLSKDRFDNSIELDLSKYDEQDREMVKNHLRVKLVLEQISQLQENINKLQEHENIVKTNYIKQLSSGKIDLNEYSELIKKNSEEFKLQIEEQRQKLQQLTEENHEVEIKLKIDNALNETDLDLQSFIEFQNALESLNSSLSDSFSNTFTEILNGQKSIKDGFKDMLSDIANQIFNFIAKRIGEQLFESLMGNMGSSNSGLLGDLGGMLSSVFGGTRASGGLVKSGVPYVVGESGREIFIPKSDGYIANNSKTEGMINNTSSNIVNNYTIKTRRGDSFNNSKLSDANLIRNLIEDSRRNI